MTDGKIDWYRTPLDKETLQRLTARSDWRGFAQVIPQLGFTTATGAAVFYAYSHWAWYVTVALLYLHGTGCGFLGMGGPGHELSHRTVFKSRFWNEFFIRVYCFISWSNFPFFRVSHTKHHAVTVYHEHDGEVVLPRKVRRIDWLYAFTFSPLAPWHRLRGTWRQACGRFDSEWERFLFPTPDAKGRRETIAWARITLAGHLALVALCVLTGHWILIVIVTLNGTYAGWLCFLCGTPQHHGLKPDVPDFRLSCRTYTLNPIARFFYWNMNYHVEHHMYAAVPFYNLPKLRRAIAHDLPVANRGLLGAWREMYAIQRRQAVEPDYCYEPPLPATASPSPLAG